MPITPRRAGAAAIILSALSAPAMAQLEDAGITPPREPDNILIDERIYYDFVRPDGTLDGGYLDTLIEIDPNFRPDAPPAGVHTLGPDGFVSVAPGLRTAQANRLEVVFVGDGYTAGELAMYAAQVDAFADDMFSYEPFTTYRPLFQIHRVDVVSNESGVDNDPVQGISRDTALGMAYWCNGIERLLCVNVSAAYFWANTAPGVDQVIALANSSKYGGAGYTSSNLGTAAAGNSFAADIIIHELGHSLGNLADEYTYGGPSAWPGGEPFSINLSTFTASEILNQQRKWWRWISETLPGFDGPTFAYEGGGYSVTGVYRPTNNSMMRNLARPFNLPSAEALIREIYRVVDPVDAHTPTSPNPAANATLVVDTVDPLIDTLEVTWTINGVAVGGDQDTLDLAAAGAQAGDVVRATVVDQTPWVRDEAIRASFMTSVIEWTIDAPLCPADLTTEGTTNGTPDGVVTLSDFAYFLGLWSNSNPAADITGDGACDPSTAEGAVTLSDFSCYIAQWSAGCP